MKGYKIFDADMKCRGFQYEVGKTYKHDGGIELCKSGFHFCSKPSALFNYYPFDNKNHVCEILASGAIQHGDDKSVCSEIKIIRELTWEEVLSLVNTGMGNSGNSNSGDRNSGNSNSGNCNSGDWNSGDCNSGNRNSGDWNSGYRNSGNKNSGDWNSGNWNSGDCNSGTWNSGDRNSGNRNSGNRNSGDWNSGNWNSGDCNSANFETGVFCSKTKTKIRMFNKQSCWTKNQWRESAPYSLLRQHFNRNTENTLKQDWAIFWAKLSPFQKKAFLELPNFNARIFYEITGIKITEEE